MWATECLHMLNDLQILLNDNYKWKNRSSQLSELLFVSKQGQLKYHWYKKIWNLSNAKDYFRYVRIEFESKKHVRMIIEKKPTH